MGQHGKPSMFNQVANQVAMVMSCVVIAGMACTTVTKADGGALQFMRSAGPFAIAVFTTPSPLRAGQVEISLMIQSTENQQPMLDCVAHVQLHKEGARTIGSEATHRVAQNKLFYAAPMNVTESGVWELEVAIRQGKNSASVTGPITVAPSTPVLLGYWRSLAVPPVFISLFALNQWLKRRRTAAQIRSANTAYPKPGAI